MAKSSKAGKKTSKRKTKKKKEEMLGGIAMTQSQALTLAMVIHNACRHLDPPEEVIEAIGPIVNQIGRVFDIESCERHAVHAGHAVRVERCLLRRGGVL